MLEVCVLPQLTERLQGCLATRFWLGVQKRQDGIMRVGETVTGCGFTGRADHEVVRVREEAADLRTETTAFCVHPNGFDRGSTNVRIR